MKRLWYSIHELVLAIAAWVIWELVMFVRWDYYPAILVMRIIFVFLIFAEQSMIWEGSNEAS